MVVWPIGLFTALLYRFRASEKGFMVGERDAASYTVVTFQQPDPFV